MNIKYPNFSNKHLKKDVNYNVIVVFIKVISPGALKFCKIESHHEKCGNYN